ncbi:MAG: cupin domain-containing protein [Dehalococcoidia bacterium]
MPVRASTSSAEPTTIAPDGIAIHTFDLPGAAHVGVAEGRIPPGRYDIHCHLSLEQFTYVISGSLTAITGDEEQSDGQAIVLDAGDLLLTLPGESLQFLNEFGEEARVLFICAPPYPPDDSDTRMLSNHGTPVTSLASDAIHRLETVRRRFNHVVDERIARIESAVHSP